MKKEHGLLLVLLILAGMTFWMRSEGPDPGGETGLTDSPSVEGVWEYPVQPGTEEWEALGSTEKRREACQIPREALEAMDTAALLETALSYPFCTDMLAFDRPEDGYRIQLRHNSALAALATRSDRLKVLRARLESMKAWLEEAGRARSAEAAFQYNCLTIFEQCME